VVKQAAERVHQRGDRESNLIRVKEVSASRGKAMRAEPISLLYGEVQSAASPRPCLARSRDDGVFPRVGSRR
jgi:phage terminase large subunit-like protein